MRVAPWLIAGMLLGGGALAADPAPQAVPAVAPATRPQTGPALRIPTKPDNKNSTPQIVFTPAEMEKLAKIEVLARERYPKRRDSPLRYVNISDNEVREIETLAAKVSIPELVNIAPVVTGCSCEEGTDCTEQVYIVGRYKDRHVGLQLSRIRNKWSIGRVQRWWLDYAALLAREKTMDRSLYDQAHARQLLEFPMCTRGANADRTAAAAAPAPSTKR